MKSLGWQTESGYLPTKAKPISVENKSMSSLKSVLSKLAEKKSSGSKETNTSRLNRGKKEKDPMKEKEKMMIPPPEKQTAEEIRTRRSLEAKAKIYEEMMNGGINKFAKNPTLINFDVKKKLITGHITKEQSDQGVNSHTEPPQEQSEDEEQQEQLPKEQQSTNPWQWSRGTKDQEDRELLEEWELEKQAEREFKSLVEQRINEEMEKTECEEDQENEREEQQSTFNETGSVSNSNPLRFKETPYYHHYSSDAKIKSQWERTINSSAKGFLKEIHQRTAVERSSKTGDRKRSLEGEPEDDNRNKKLKF
jgi:hypothetical protein